MEQSVPITFYFMWIIILCDQFPLIYLSAICASWLLFFLHLLLRFFIFSMALGFSTIKIYELEKIISDYTLTSVCHNDVHEYIFKWFILKGFLKYQVMFPTLKHCLPLVFKGGFFLKMWLWYRGCFTAVKFTILKKTQFIMVT